jgi:hypothetical protein
VFIVRCQQSDNVPIICKFAAGAIDTGGKFAAGFVDTSGKFATSINNTSGTGSKMCCRSLRYRWWTLTGKYLCEFLKQFKITPMLHSGAWRKIIHKKNLKQKSCDTVPLNIMKYCGYQVPQYYNVLTE